MTTDDADRTRPGGSHLRGSHLRLVWPQWQGAGLSSIETFAGELPLEVARRGYAVGTRVLEAILPPHEGPSAVVPTELGERGLAHRDGIDAKDIVLEQLASALDLIRDHEPDRITTLGGDCAVSVAPFAALAERYCEDLAIVGIDSHPDVDTNETGYAGYHAMAVSALTGHGDPDVLALLPATIPASRVALAGVHSWEEDAYANVAAWGSPSSRPTRCARAPATWSSGSARPARPRSRSISTSTRSTPPRRGSGSGPTSAVSPRRRPAGS
ncbi:arginase family protein [Salana multivorans]